MMRIFLSVVIITIALNACKSKTDEQRIVERTPQREIPVTPDTTRKVEAPVAETKIAPDTSKPVPPATQQKTEEKPKPETPAPKEQPADTAKPQSPAQQIRNKRWKLVEFHGEQVVVTPDFDREPYITLALHSNKLTGSGGCNRFGCKYALDGDKIKLDQFAATKKTCKNVMDLERGFLRDLETATSFEVQGDTLWLLKNGKRQMKFNAVYL